MCLVSSEVAPSLYVINQLHDLEFFFFKESGGPIFKTKDNHVSAGLAKTHPCHTPMAKLLRWLAFMKSQLMNLLLTDCPHTCHDPFLIMQLTASLQCFHAHADVFSFIALK